VSSFEYRRYGEYRILGVGEKERLEGEGYRGSRITDKNGEKLDRNRFARMGEVLESNRGKSKREREKTKYGKERMKNFILGGKLRKGVGKNSKGGKKYFESATEITSGRIRNSGNSNNTRMSGFEYRISEITRIENEGNREE